jgi:hypothetical protein
MRDFTNNSLQCPIEIIISTKYLTQRDSNDVHSALDQHTSLDLYSVSSLKPQSEGRRVAPIGHIILIPIQSVFVLSNQITVYNVL